MYLRDFICHVFTPHTLNNHRARALHPTSILVYMLFFILFQTGIQTIYRSKPEILGYATNINIEDLLKLTNEKRRQNGLGELKINNKLIQAANRKAVDMFNQNYWAHNSPAGTTPWHFFIDADYQYIVAGENLAKNFSDSPGVVEAWMNSPSHRENLLKQDYQDIGFAIVDGTLQGEPTTLVVQMFGTEKQTSLAVLPTQILEPTPTLAILSTKENQPEINNVISRPLNYSEQLLSYKIAGVKKTPFFDIVSIKKQLSMAFLTFLITVLMIDGYLVYKHKKIRIAGRNWAHIIFLISILGIIYLAKTGSIL